MTRGRFIVFEGIDGAGKSTQIERLTALLVAMGRTVHRTAEPTALDTGRMLRTALAGKEDRSPAEMAALFTLDRIAHNKEINAALEAGEDVICDRYYYSSMAYQGSETDPEWVRHMNLDCPEILRPDVCIFLDLTPEQSMARINRGRATQEIYENEEKLTAVRNQFYRVFEELCERDNVRVVNAYRSIEEIHEEIVGLIG